MNCLAIDTAGTDCCVGLLRSDGQLFSRVESAVQSHSRCILAMIDSLLEQASISLPMVQLLVWNAGPGSFTGIRIAASIVQSLSYSLQIPFLSLSSLEILAYAAMQREPSAPEVRVALDARMNGVYWASFAVEQGVLRRTAEDQLIAKAAFETQQQTEKLSTALMVGDAWSCATRLDINMADLIALAQTKPQQDWQYQAADCLPNYVQSNVGWQKRTRLQTPNA